MPGLDWLTARPVAHRGLHAPGGAVENTASAVRAAIDAGYAVEADLQVSADGEAMVHHDDALGRLAPGDGRLAEMTAAQLKGVAFRATADPMMALDDLLALVAGRVALFLELKSRFDADPRLVLRTISLLTDYAGPVAVMSFDPDQVRALRENAPGLPRGIVAERHYAHPDWQRLAPARRRHMANLLHALSTRPHFVAYSVADLPAVAPLLARHVFGLPLLAWTVRTEADRLRATRWADQMIFEGLRP